MRRVVLAFFAAVIALGGAVAWRSAQPAGAAPDAAGTFASLPPARILDTRVGTGLNGAFAPNQIRDLAVTGVGGVPASGVDAVAVNVTVTAPSAAGFLTLFPAGQALPLASNLNFVAGQTVPNVVVVKVGHGGSKEGRVSILNSAGTTHVIADVVGWYSDGTTKGAGFTGLTPNRILDTRVSGGAFGPNETRKLTVTGAGVPASSLAVVLNVTVTQPTAAGYLTLYPAGLPSPPLASSLNFVPGLTVPNLVIVKVGAGGQVSILNSAGSTHVIADVVGYYEAGTGSSLTSMAPQRILDTRTGPSVPVQPNATITIDPGGPTGVPPVGAYSGVIVNVTVTSPTQAGHLTAFPSDAALPLASNLNFTASQTAPNLVMVKVGADGRFKIANTRLPANPQPSAGTVHVIVDLVGYYASTSQSTAPPCGQSGAPPAVYDHVVWIWMENHQAGQVIGSPNAPYETAIAQQCGTATDYESVGSPSLPNYIGATSGATQQIADDGSPAQHPLGVDNLFRQVRARGLTERSYDESMPANCALSSVGLYAVKHNPAAYYAGAADRPACQADDVPLGDLSAGALIHDLDTGTLPAFAFVTPNLCSDTHDCPVATGDAWLKAWIPTILAKATGRTAILLVWDEPTPMPFVAIAPTVPAATVISSRLDHYALLRTTEEMLGITELLGAAANAPSMRAPFDL